MLRYRVSTADGRRVEHNTPIGLVQKFPKDEDAWREVDRLGILIRINDAPTSNRIRFDALAEHYLKADFGADAGVTEATTSRVDGTAIAGASPSMAWTCEVFTATVSTGLA